MKALILLGGLGTRLRPLTCSTPKPLLPLVNKPTLLYQLDLIKKAKIRDVIFCTGHMSKNFDYYFRRNGTYGMKIDYLREKEPLGTGGAIKNAERYMDSTTVIFNGDILTDIDINKLINFHHENKALVTIALIRVKDPTIYGLVETDRKSRIERFLEKPSWDEVTCNTINAGIYIFEPEVLEYIPRGVNYSLERGLFPMLLEKKKIVMGYADNAYWLDIGTVEKYLQAHYDLLGGGLKFKIFGKNPKFIAGRNTRLSHHVEINGRAAIGDNTRVDEYVQFNGLVSVGNNCHIKKGCQLKDAVILDGTSIGEGAVVENAIVGEKCTLEPNVVINSGNVLGVNSYVTRFSKL